MSNYTPIISYGPKDSLTHGDPNKLIKGTQIDAELAAIATAIATKNDSLNYPVAVGSGATPYLTANSGGVSGWGPVAGSLRDLTPDIGSFTANYTGFSGTVTGQGVWFRIGRIGFLFLGVATGTSNANSFLLTNLPSVIQPTGAYNVPVSSVAITDNGTVLSASGALVSATIGGPNITFVKNSSSTAWTASGTKGISISILIPIATT